MRDRNEPLVETCPNCLSPTLPTWRYCSTCGSPLDAALAAKQARDAHPLRPRVRLPQALRARRLRIAFPWPFIRLPALPCVGPPPIVTIFLCLAVLLAAVFLVVNGNAGGSAGRLAEDELSRIATARVEGVAVATYIAAIEGAATPQPTAAVEEE